MHLSQTSHRQLDGVAIGNHLGPISADIFIVQLGEPVKNKSLNSLHVMAGPSNFLFSSCDVAHAKLLCSKYSLVSTTVESGLLSSYIFSVYSVYLLMLLYG